MAACRLCSARFRTQSASQVSEASSIFASTSNSAVMWVTSLDGDFRPRRLFLEESHLTVTKVTWQFSSSSCLGASFAGSRGRGRRWHLASRILKRAFCRMRVAGAPEQLGPVLELVPLRFCGDLPWRPRTPQLRL